jgi:23S rRNA pseudouridine2605 synthase
MERVQKIIAASGLCSRRRAEELIKAGSVTVNGVRATTGMSADPIKDLILVGKQRVEVGSHTYLMLNKPSGFLTTRGDVWSRKDVMSLVSNAPRPVYPVGRLDRDARGLLLFTSDGEFAQRVAHPRHNIPKTYQVMVDKPFRSHDSAALVKGVLIDRRLVNARVRRLKPRLIEITVHEGRNKIIKRLCNKLGYFVSDLKRVGVGTIRLNVPEGKWRLLTQQEIEQLLKKQ